MGIETLPAPFPDGAVAAFTTRRGGVSVGPWAELNLGLHVEDEPERVLANRDLLRRELGAPVRFARQVHGADVLVVDGNPSPEAASGEGPAADALVTDLPGTPLGVLVADCLPVLLADVSAGVVGVAHAGRGGLVAGVLTSTVASMAGLGAEPLRTVAAIGPAAGSCCYEVPAGMRDEVGAAVPGSAATTTWGTPSLDLRAGAVALLRALGVGAVHLVGGCTIEDERFYSYRRDRRTGRFAGLVMRSA